jgi:hypothetical protein
MLQPAPFCHGCNDWSLRCPQTSQLSLHLQVALSRGRQLTCNEIVCGGTSPTVRRVQKAVWIAHTIAL